MTSPFLLFFDFIYCMYILYYNRLNEMVHHLQLERQKLINDCRNLEQSNESFQSELEKLKEMSQLREQELEEIGNNDRNQLQV
jgi:hypothetical protein